ncbi:hypothetical protein E2C01_025440 [Portunus trituberculatus]|uniref:F-box domain-containing protein n=1 Tax=Portunus trituberculatus TaxID=210409 RepID=A0A5B7EFJ1_PORTR|nr:hypothetical protein [Portunus trituberculatus]
MKICNTVYTESPPAQTPTHALTPILTEVLATSGSTSSLPLPCSLQFYFASLPHPTMGIIGNEIVDQVTIGTSSLIQKTLYNCETRLVKKTHRQRISACSTCKAWRSALFHPSFWRRIELVFVAGEWRRLERSRFVASWAARKLRSCVIHFETVNTNCLVEVDHVLLKITRNPQVSSWHHSNTSLLAYLLSPIVQSISCVI